ncbi:unnamed protein product [Peniophora sp. CBMAI 1063]|nr:unnamed protein product [Peniophora sp. CBMAI 1063]
MRIQKAEHDFDIDDKWQLQPTFDLPFPRSRQPARNSDAVIAVHANVPTSTKFGPSFTKQASPFTVLYIVNDSIKAKWFTHVHHAIFQNIQHAPVSITVPP